MERKTVDIEYLIRNIETIRPSFSVCSQYVSGLDNPEVLAQHAQFYLGAHEALNKVTNLLLELQGADDE